MKPNKTFLFVNANGSQKIYQDLAKSHSAIEPHPWLLLLPNSLRAKGVPVAILDCEAKGLTLEESVQAIRSIDPAYVIQPVYGQQPSASTQNMQGAIDLAQALKQEYGDYKTVFLGPHVSALPYETLAFDCVDYICQNEGVYTLHELAEGKDCEYIKGLGWKDKFGIPHLNQLCPVVPSDQLDTVLPGLALDLIDIRDYRTSNWHVGYAGDPYRFASIYTSLGCYATCDFCLINIINRDKQGNLASNSFNKMRYWSVDFVLSELDKMAKLGVRNLKWSDEMAIYKPNHFMKILNGIIDRGYKFNQWMYARVNTIKESYLETMAKAGVSFIGVGIEAANQNIRQESTKGSFKDTDIRQIVKLVESYGIEVGSNYIVGLPMETYETMNETLDLALELNTSLANIYCCMAYPGSPLHLQAKQDKKALPDTFDGYSQHSYNCFPLSGQNLTNAEILKFRDYAWNKYFTNPSFLNMIRGKFGQDAVDHITSLTKIRLNRKLLGH